MSSTKIQKINKTTKRNIWDVKHVVTHFKLIGRAGRTFNLHDL